MLAAISAATDFAVNMAAKHQLTLLGFARQDKATVYCGKERLIFNRFRINRLTLIYGQDVDKNSLNPSLSLCLFGCGKEV